VLVLSKPWAARRPTAAPDRVVGEQPDQRLGVTAEGRGEDFLDDLPRGDRIDLGTGPAAGDVVLGTPVDVRGARSPAP
jgi:hypothetical protein